MANKKFDRIFNPKTIAVIGASNDKDNVGYGLFNNIFKSDYKGKVYPVNIKRSKVQGIKAYKSVIDIPDNVDLAIIATPVNTVVSLVEECGKKRVEGVIIVSSGFLESGKKGKERCSKIIKIAKKYKIRIIGPNCLGFIRTAINLNATFYGKMPLKGNIAFISQSGALGSAMLDWSIQHNIGFSFFASIGSMIDVGFSDIIDYLGNDPETTSIVIYMESLKDARKFLSAARAFSRNKPIIVLKSGKSPMGARAALSHTGNLAGNDDVFKAAFKRAGIVRVNEIDDLFNCAKTLSKQKRPLGNKLAIITNAGGPGVIATDSLIEMDGELANLDKKTLKKLDEFLPFAWSRGNPVDLLGDAGPERYRRALEICLEDENVDGILVVLTPQTMTDSVAIAKVIIDMQNKSKKPILASFMGGESVSFAKSLLEKSNIPVFPAPERAVKSFMYLYLYEKNMETLYQTPSTIPHAFKPRTEENKKLIKTFFDKKKYILDSYEAKKILFNYDIPVGKDGLAKNSKEAVEIAKNIGFPVAMKIASPDILHKTDIGAVKLNIDSKEDVKKAYDEIIETVKKKVPNAKINGVMVEEMFSKKHELLIGCKKDPIFGPIIVFGMGGVAVSVFKDIDIGLPPLNMALSLMLIKDTKIYELLKGYRGIPGVDIKSIQFLLYKFAYLVSDFPEIKEIDINPFGVDEQGGVVLDAKIILDKNLKRKKIKPYSHLVISPYPKEYIKEFRMKDGKTAVFRPIRPEDEPLEGEMFTKFSKETERFRFFGYLKDITHETLVRYTQIDYDREMAIIAELEEEGRKKMAGVVRIIYDPYEEGAEFAMVVADPWHGKGLGVGLTEYILEIAKEKGIKKIYALFLPDNKTARHIFEKLGFKITREEDLCRAELEL